MSIRHLEPQCRIGQGYDRLANCWSERKALQIAGGADFAENFDVDVASSNDQARARRFMPGMVVDD